MLSRNTLAVNLRFLDNAINKLPLKTSIITETVATDGRYIFYDESYVLKSYKSGYNLTRAYLHMMLHCVFRHNIVGTLVDTLRWNLACDIAAENIMNELDIKALSSPRQVRQGSIIDKIKTDCRFVTAEKIYDYLLRNVDDLQVTTLNGGSYMKYKNDASFLLCMSLYMFEQQSSKNPNMPLRFLHYVSDVFRELFSNSMLHRRSMIKIPVPHFVTFYNGLENGLKMRMKSGCPDMYEIPTDNPELELKVRVININEDVHILNKCKTLRDYMTFVNKVRFKMGVEGDNVRIAVTEAMNECIDEDILVDFFEQHREEVVEVSIYDYDEEKLRKTLADEAREEGEQLKVVLLIIKKVKKSKSTPNNSI